MTDPDVLVGAAAQEKAQGMDQLATDPLNWKTLYRDRVSGELWKMTFPHSEMHGGGSPQLERTTHRLALLEFDLTDGDLGPL